MPINQTNQQINWESFVNAAKSATIIYVNDWIVNTYIRVGVVNGSIARVPCGGLESRTPIDFAASLRLALVNIPGVSFQIAEDFAKQVWGTWKQWYQECEIFIPVAFLSFAAYPGPYAALTPMPMGVPFVLGFAPTRNKQLNPVLKQKLVKVAQDLPQTVNTQSHQASPQAFNRNNVAAGSWKSGAARTFQQANVGFNANPNAQPNAQVTGLTPQKAMEDYADWFEERLEFWKMSARIGNLLGEGPVPSFNPTASVLVGPVVNGTLRGERVLSGRFG